MIRDLSLPKKKGLAVVTITGKGNKTRRCPLWQHTREALSSIIKNRTEDDHVFLNRVGQPITRFGIYEMVTRYAEKIEDKMPTIKRNASVRIQSDIQPQPIYSNQVLISILSELGLGMYPLIRPIFMLKLIWK